MRESHHAKKRSLIQYQVERSQEEDDDHHEPEVELDDEDVEEDGGEESERTEYQCDHMSTGVLENFPTNLNILSTFWA